MPQTPESKKLPGGFVLTVFACLGLWLYFQAKEPEPATSGHLATAQVLASQTPTQVPVVVMTPSELYTEYSSNEVATDQRLSGKTIQITAPVMSIDKDFMNSAVLKFSTGDEFNAMSITLEDTQKAQAANLSRGQIVTVQCKTMHRILESPMGGDCVFAEKLDANTPTQATSQVLHQDVADTPPSAQTSALSSTQRLDQLIRKMDRAAKAGTATEYAAAIQNAVTPNWVRPDNLPQAPCEVHITQLPGGVVVSAVADDSCPYDTAGKLSVENAVLRSQPLPYRGFEGEFQRNLTMTFIAQ